MNDVFRLKLPAARDHGLAHLDRRQTVAFFLDRGAAAGADGPGDTAPKPEVLVGGVDHRFDIEEGNIALDNPDPLFNH
jgi:hypothetical protein